MATGIRQKICDYCGKPFVAAADDDDNLCDSCMRDLIGER